MTASCCHPNVEKHGMSSGHAYTLLDVLEVGGTLLAKMRNPWSSERYTGPWSDKDSRWTDALKKEAGMTAANDGVFFMPYRDFMDKYRRTSVSLYDTSLKHS